MVSKFAPFFRACCAAGSLTLGLATAAERAPSLVGATRDEVLSRFGDPRSQLVAGTREVLLYPTERIVLRDNRVVEVEELTAETTPAPAPAKAAPSPAKESAEPAASVPQARASADSSPAPSLRQSTAPTAPPGESTVATTPPPPIAPEVQIKSVRPPSNSIPAFEIRHPSAPRPPRPAPTPNAAAQSAAAEAGLTATSLAVAASPATAATLPGDAGKPVRSGPPPSNTALPASPAPGSGPAVDAPSTATEAAPEPSHAQPVRPQPAAPIRQGVRGAEPASGAPNLRHTLLALAIIAGGGGFLVWRRRQRNLALEVTTASRLPAVAEPTPAAIESRFSADVLNRLEWKRFEELVAAYYNKTGVVATRTQTGPQSPVHIRISWKGEQRPFAGVQCIPHSAELLDPRPIQDLGEALAAEGIRRGYVVTAGKFGVPARDLAAEKHITLLPGDVFLEKLNALPPLARAELIKEATAGDFTTPTCPRCDIKAARAANGQGWQCLQCGTLLPNG